MNPKPFEYHAPKSVAEASSLAEKYGTDAKFLAGGQSLIPLMKLRLLSPSHLIDLGRIPGLSYIRDEGHDLAIGALVRMGEIARSDLVRRHCPILSQCAHQIADPLVRNMGTIGGNLSHADPTNDMPAVMVAAGASIVAASGGGSRVIPAGDFFVDTFTTALKGTEVLVEVKVPIGPTRRGAYLKLERQAGDFGIVGVAAVLEMSSDGRCAAAGIALTGVGPTVVKAARAGEILKGAKPDKNVIDRASRAAAEEAQPSGDLRGSAEYKRAMVETMTARAIQAAVRRQAER
ncbi:MAG: xanthine dehydrogenase family protein subunit M [Thaumarchaeota archaeon]|nr:MAG: xanthine dehydrogenase family protein subunit M [Nitrososphaerota archaeon]